MSANSSAVGLQLQRTGLRVGRQPSRQGVGQRITIHYRGRILDGGAPAEGQFDLGFLLHEDALSAETSAAPVVRRGVQMRDGAFSVVVDFDGVASPRDLWLSVGVRRSSGPKEALRLFPRVPLAATTRPTIGEDSAQFSL